jgi:hypothetical protein
LLAQPSGVAEAEVFPVFPCHGIQKCPDISPSEIRGLEMSGISMIVHEYVDSIQQDIL